MTRGDPGMTRYIEPKLSLMWLLGTGGTVITLLVVGVWNLASANAQMERIVTAVTRLESQLELRDSRIDKLNLDIQGNRSINEVQNARLANVEEQLRAIKAFSGIKP